MWIEIDVTPEMIRQARDKMFEPNSRTFSKDEVRMRGFLGEVDFEQRFRKSKRINGYGHDYKLNNKLIEVKARGTPGYPFPKKEFIITKKSYDFDYIVFYQVKKDLSKMWLIGYLPMNKVKEVSTKRYKPGDLLSNGVVVKHGGLVIELKDVLHMPETKQKEIA